MQHSISDPQQIWKTLITRSWWYEPPFMHVISCDQNGRSQFSAFSQGYIYSFLLTSRTLRVNNFEHIQHWLLIFCMLQDTGNHGLPPKFDEASFKTSYFMLKIEVAVKHCNIHIVVKTGCTGKAMSRNFKWPNFKSTKHSNMKFLSVTLPYLMFNICNYQT